MPPLWLELPPSLFGVDSLLFDSSPLPGVAWLFSVFSDGVEFVPCPPSLLPVSVLVLLFTFGLFVFSSLLFLSSSLLLVDDESVLSHFAAIKGKD
nr:hypothetical protein [Mycoplasmopsis agalactiae]